MNNRHTLLALCIAAALAGANARAGDRVDKTLAADAAGVVEIDNVRGEVAVIGWDKPEVRLAGELDDLADELVFERDGKRTRIEVKLPDDNIDSGDGSTLSVHVPGGSRVEVRSVSADTSAKDIGGGLTVRTVSGDVVADKVRGNLTIKTVSGDMHVDSAGGSSQLKTVSGDLALTLDSREVDVGTVSGDVTLALGEFDRLGITSVSGDLRTSGTLARGGRIECKTVSGTCELTLRGKVDARISAHTAPGGDIENGLNDVEPEEIFPSQQRLETTVGDGTGSISASTVSGDIRLQRE